MKYYPITKRWQKIKRHLDDKVLNDTLVKDFNKYTFGRWNKKFSHGQFPHDFESCDWWCDHRGRMPTYWKYVKHAACHWLVNFNLRLAQLVEPDRPWRIVTSQQHSTVWDGDETLFDMNFMALGIEPDESFRLANKKHLAVGKQLRVYWAEHYSVERRD